VSDARCCYRAEAHAVDSARRHQPLLFLLLVLLAISNALLSSSSATPEREQPRKGSGAAGCERNGDPLAPPSPPTHSKTVLHNELSARSREVAREERVPAGEDGERGQEDEDHPTAHPRWDCAARDGRHVPDDAPLSNLDSTYEHKLYTGCEPPAL